MELICADVGWTDLNEGFQPNEKLQVIRADGMSQPECYSCGPH